MKLTNLRVYLDNNATTPIAREVLDEYARALSIVFGNPSSIHQEGQLARSELQEARRRIAAHLNVMPQEIIFTASATEALNLILRGFFGYELKGHVISSSIEHAAVYATLQDLQPGIDVTFLSPDASGQIAPQQVLEAIRPDTRLITLMAVNNETGVCIDIDSVSDIAGMHNIPFVVDGVALFGKKRFHIKSGCSAMVFSGHKFHAPKGISFAFIRKSFRLHPWLTGGEQEFGRRAGTENVPACMALAKAVELALHNLDDTLAKIGHLRDYFESRLKKELSQIAINGSGQRVCTTSNILFPKLDGEALVMYLDLHGVAASLGSACATGAIEPSRVLLQMGLTQEEAVASIRFSLSRFTTKDEIDAAIAVIVQGVAVQT